MNVKTYKEWSNLQVIEDPQNPFSTLYAYEDGSMFYIEPIFYTQLMGFEEHRPGCIVAILKEMEQIVKNNKKVIFAGEYDIPLTRANVDDFIILEIFDITDKLQIYVEDKSRGSDYGD